MSSVLQELMVVFSSYNKDREGDSRFVIAIIIYKCENYKHIHQFSFFSLILFFTNFLLDGYLLIVMNEDNF